MIPFLKSVAEGYAAHALDNISHYCFVFPNKRARTFFLKYLRRATLRLSDKGEGTSVIAPHSTTITDLVSLLSQRVVDSRIDLIFLLYNSFRELFPNAASFDEFRRWGETVLSDFNEVDMNLSDPEAVFKNLSDFREISTSFLTPEQREVIEEYFGYHTDSYDDSSFWRDFSDSQDNASESRKKFIRLWKVLYPLYIKFHENLREKGLTTSGAAYRLAIENLETARGNDDVGSLLPYGKIVMVGFNALSGAERDLFSLFKEIPSPLFPDESLGDYVWDATGPVICRSKNSAGHFVMRNIKHFPAPDWLLPYLSRSDAGNSMPEITTVSAPSKVAQVKIASGMISDLHKRIGNKDFDEARVALILPDESLLIPMLYSMPSDIEDANLTMGYPLKLTAVSSFLMLLRKMQLFRRDSSSYAGYAFEEMDNLLSHPYAQAIIGQQRIRDFRKEFTTKHIRVVKDSDIRERLGDNAETLLNPIPRDASPEMVCRYLDTVLEMIGAHLPTSVEKAHVDAWREALNVFTDAIREYDISMSPVATMAEAYRLLVGEIVPFEGEPLKGLQIMGLLETRLLDFDHIFIVSVNDKVIPMRSRKRSFIPNVIRRAYGMPPVNYQENIFSYYFYRLLSRTKSATLIYDDRASGLSGGVSRYLMQLKYLHARGKIKELEYKFNPTAKETEAIVIEKSDEIMSILNRFRADIPLSDDTTEEQPRRFSATSLKKYLSCPLKFYYNSLRDLKDDPAPGDGVDNITYGNIFHKIMEILYLPKEEVDKGRWLETPVEITSDFIDNILADEDRLKTLIRRLINKEHYKLKSELKDRDLEKDTEIVAESMLLQLRRLLNYDKSLTPFKIYGCEVRNNIELTTETGKIINMTYAIDRIDDAECQDSELAVRIVDYKTGSPHVKAETLPDIFGDGYESDHLFQLLLYADLLNETRAQNGEAPLSIKPLIYSIPKIFDPRKRKESVPKIGSDFIEFHDQDWDEEAGTTVIDEFMSEFDATIEQIFDPEIPFAAHYDEQKCSQCVYRSLCAANNVNPTPQTPSSTTPRSGVASLLTEG